MYLLRYRVKIWACKAGRLKRSTAGTLSSLAVRPSACSETTRRAQEQSQFLLSPRTTGSNSLPKPARHNSLLWLLKTQKPPAPESTQQEQRGRCPPNEPSCCPLTAGRAPHGSHRAHRFLTVPLPLPYPPLGSGPGGPQPPRIPPGSYRRSRTWRPATCRSAPSPAGPGQGAAAGPGGTRPGPAAQPRLAPPRLSSARNGRNGPAAHAASAPRHGGREPPQ